MKAITPTKFLVGLALAVLAFVIAFAAQTCWFFAYGRVAASTSVELGAVHHRVVLRERCISDPIIGTLDRLGFGRVAEYEYWAELRRGFHLVAASEREHWDSAAFDHPHIESADVSGATVVLDPASSYPSTHRFDWRTSPTSRLTTRSSEQRLAVELSLYSSSCVASLCR